jgi:hypothetical protein
MKTCAFFLLFGCMATACFAEIKNGYSEIAGAHSSLNSILKLLKENKSLSYPERQSLKQRRDELQRYIIQFTFTEKLLEIFKSISPELYAEIDSLTDSRGRRVDVYVKFLPEKQMPRGVAGITSLSQGKFDSHACESEYGPNTVSVKIVAGNKSLAVLAHELGHVLYQTRNLAAYTQYYLSSYGNSGPSQKFLGHNDRDDSGRKAMNFVARFKRYFLNYRRMGNKKPQSNHMILKRIERRLKNHD